MKRDVARELDRSNRTTRVWDNLHSHSRSASGRRCFAGPGKLWAGNKTGSAPNLRVGVGARSIQVDKGCAVHAELADYKMHGEVQRRTIGWASITQNEDTALNDWLSGIDGGMTIIPPSISTSRPRVQFWISRLLFACARRS